MTWTWWLVPVVVLGVALIGAPFLGSWWARDFRPVSCESCGRELVGSPPMHTLTDRAHCRAVSVSRGDVL